MKTCLQSGQSAPGGVVAWQAALVVNGPDRMRLDVGPSPKDDIDVVFIRARSIAWNDDRSGTVVIKATGNLPTRRVNAVLSDLGAACRERSQGIGSRAHFERSRE